MTDPGKNKTELEDLNRKLDEHLARKIGDVTVLSDPIDGDYWFKEATTTTKEKS